METSEREKLMGMFCQRKEENKKPATEDRTTKHCPLEKGLHRYAGNLLTCRAQVAGETIHRLEDAWACHPRPTDIKEAELDKKSSGKEQSRRGVGADPTGRLHSHQSTQTHCHQGKTASHPQCG